MGRNKMIYCPCLIICHGKSEYIFASFLRLLTRLPIEVLADKKGTKSIQITSLLKYFNNSIFRNQTSIKRSLKSSEIKINHGKFMNFRIFTIMDVDEPELTVQMINDYKSGTMFKNLWLSEYITPIYNQDNFDSVISACSCTEKAKSKDKIAVYSKLFQRSMFTTIEDLISFLEKSKSKSNMVDLVKYLSHYAQ